MVERQRRLEVVALLRAMLVSALLATFALIAILLVFSAVSVLRTFELYPHDALFLIELVIALLAASTVGVLYAHQHYQR